MRNAVGVVRTVRAGTFRGLVLGVLLLWVLPTGAAAVRAAEGDAAGLVKLAFAEEKFVDALWDDFEAVTKTTAGKRGEKAGWIGKHPPRFYHTMTKKENHWGTDHAGDSFMRNAAEMWFDVDGHTLHVPLAPGRYRVWMLLGDDGYDQGTVYANGESVVDLPRMTYQRFYRTRTCRNFKTWVTPGMSLWETYADPITKGYFMDVEATEVRKGVDFHFKPLERERGLLLYALMAAPVAEAAALEREVAAIREKRKEEFDEHFRKKGWLIPVEEAPAPDLSDQPAVRERGYGLYVRPCSSPFGPLSRPAAYELGPELRVFATPGEYEPVQLCVYPLRDLEKVQVAVSDLVCGAHSIPQDRIRVDFRAFSPTKVVGEGMSRLLPRRYWTEGVDLVQCSSFWFTVHVPLNAAPGMYRGTVTVTPANAPATETPFVLRVLPFLLQDPPDRVLCVAYMPHYARVWERDYDRYWATVEMQWRDIRAHGFTPQPYYVPWNEIGIVRKRKEIVKQLHAGTFELVYDPDKDYRALFNQGVPMGINRGAFGQLHFVKRYSDLYRSLGFRGPLAYVIGWYAHLLADKEAPIGSEEYEERVARYVMAVQAAFRKYDIEPLIGPTYDEPLNSGKFGWDLVRSQSRAFRRAGTPYMVHFNGAAWDLLPHLDIPVVQPAVGISDKSAARIESEGRRFWVYNRGCYRHAMGYWFWRTGASNLMQVSYGLGAGHQHGLHIREFLQSGRFVVSVPVEGPDGIEPGIAPKVYWEKMREGADDLRYLHTLERLLAMADGLEDAAVRKAAAEARSVLAYIRSRIPLADDRIERPVNNQTPNMYDRLRWLVAREILRVREALAGRSPKAPEPAAALPEVSKGEWRVQDAPAPQAADVRRPPAESKIPPTAVLHLRRTDRPPAIDGRLGDACWKKARWGSNFALIGGGTPKEKTEVAAAFDAENLYIAFRCHDRDPAAIRGEETRRDSYNVLDDLVEIMIQPDRGRKLFHHFIEYFSGARFDRLVGDPEELKAVEAAGGAVNVKWNADYPAATRRTDTGWVCEVALPFATFGVKEPPDGTVWGANFGRHFRPHPMWDASWSWGFNRIEHFGVLVFDRVDTALVHTVRWPEIAWRENEVAVLVTNPGKRPVTLVGTVRDADDELGRKRFQLGAGERETLSIPFRLRKNGACELSATLAMADGRELAEDRHACRVEPVALDLPADVVYTGENVLFAELSCNLSPKTRERAGGLELVLRRAGGEAVARRRIPLPTTRRRQLQMDVTGLPAGAYEVEARLVESGEAGESSRVPWQRAPGPWDLVPEEDA